MINKTLHCHTILFPDGVTNVENGRMVNKQTITASHIMPQPQLHLDSEQCDRTNTKILVDT